MTNGERAKAVPFMRLFLRMGGWFTVAFAALACVFVVISQDRTDLAKRFAAEGREATATVQDRYLRETEKDGKTRTSRFLTLKYTTHDERTVELNKGVTRDRYDSVREGDTLNVLYLDAMPRRIAFSLQEERSGAIIPQVIGLGFGVLALAGLWYSGGHAVAAVRARRYGKREAATVTGVKRTDTKINREYRYRLTWREADGREGESLMYPRDALANYPEGSEIIVYQGLKRAWWTGDVGERPDAE